MKSQRTTHIIYNVAITVMVIALVIVGIGLIKKNQEQKKQHINQ